MNFSQKQSLGFLIYLKVNISKMADNNLKKWYVVRAVSGQENKVKSYIETEISRLGMSDYISQVLVPTEKVVQVRDGKKISKDKVYFPGYVMIEANLVGEILSTIDPEASCYSEAKALSDKIGKRVYELDKREWNYKLETEVNLKRDLIKAWRDIGVAFGNGQPKNYAYNIIGWGR